MRPQPHRRSAKFRAVLEFPLTRVVIAFGAIALFAFPILAASSATHLRGLPASGLHLLAALGACGIYVVYVRRLEHRAPDELALKDLAPQFGLGFAIGSGLFGAMMLILWFSGSYRVIGINGNAAVPTIFVGALGAALLEEIAVRGVLFRIMEESLGTWYALALSALIFGLLHGVNPGESWRDLAGIALGAGVFLAAVFVYARQLWIGIGLHCAWNFNEGGLYGIIPNAQALLSAQIRGPDWLTGGVSGLNSSLIEILICLAATAAFLLLARARGRIVAPSWKKHRALLAGA